MRQTGNTIQTLYARLFKELEDLQAGEVEVEHANAVACLSNAITRAAEVELKFVSKTGCEASGFVPEVALEAPAPRAQHAIGRPRPPQLPKLMKTG